MYSSTPDLFDLLLRILSRAPLYLVWLAGLLIALVYLGRYPRVSVVTMIAMVLCFVIDVVMSVVYSALPTAVPAATAEPVPNVVAWMGGPARLAILLAGLTHALLMAVVYLLLLRAIFGWRPPPTEPMPTGPDVADSGDRSR
jgi:hypothetical protein